MPTLHADKTRGGKFPRFDVEALLHAKWDGTLMMVVMKTQWDRSRQQHAPTHVMQRHSWQPCVKTTTLLVWMFGGFFQPSFPHLVVVRRQLIEQLLDAELFTRAVDIGDLVLRQTGEIQLDLRTVKMYVVVRDGWTAERCVIVACGETLERWQQRRGLKGLSSRRKRKNLSKIYICKYAAVINPDVWMCFGLKAERPSEPKLQSIKLKKYIIVMI